MALITCPECGRKVSDMAAACPDCGYPIKSLRTDGKVRISNKVSMVGSWKIMDYNTREPLWTGKPSQVAVFQISKPTEIYMAWGINSGKKPAKKQPVYTIRANKVYEFVEGHSIFTDPQLNEMGTLDE